MNAPSDVVGKTAVVLRALSAREPEGARTTAVARATGLPRPTVHRLLSALLGCGLVDRTPEGRWLLGAEMYLMGAAASRRYDVTELARPYVRRLAAETGESAFYSARSGDETVCLIREDGSFPIRSHVLYEGIRFPLGVASAGLAILSYLSDAEIDAYLTSADLTAYGEQHAPDAVRSRVATTRHDGYALNPGLIVEGSWGMGAVVFDHRDRPRGALSLTGIEQRFGPAERARHGALLLRTAHELTAALRSPGAGR